MQLGPLGLFSSTKHANGRDSGSNSSDSGVEVVEGASDAAASESDHELEYDDSYDEDQLEYEAALESDAHCSDGSW